MKQDKREEGVQPVYASEHDGGVGKFQEEASETKNERGKKIAEFFGKLPFKGRPVVVVAAVVLVLALILAIRWMADNHETRYLATSDLKSAVDIDSLSTIDYTYHGIAEKHSKFLWLDRVDYRVKYEAHVRASYTMSDIQFDIDEESKVVTAYLPKARVDEPQLDNNKFGYLPESANADMKDVLALCRKDAAGEVDKKEIEKQAEASLRDTVKALTLPFVTDEYKLEFKPLTEYKEGADSNA